MADSVLIVGGGRAGLALSILLSRANLNVWVIERSNYTEPRIGEHLPPSSIQMINTLTPHRRFPNDIHMPSSGVDAYWGQSSPNQMDYLFHPIGTGVNLSRPEFDRDLAFDCREAGAHIATSATLVSADWRRTYWQATIKLPNEIVELRPKLIIDASGRRATFARSQGAAILAEDQQIAVVDILSPNIAGEKGGRVLIESCECGWWYRAALASGHSITMYMTDADALPRGGKAKLREWWVNQISKTDFLRTKVGDQNCTAEHLKLQWACSQRLTHASGGGWLAIGDAACAFDPLSSRGIAKGLMGAQFSADTVSRYLSGYSNALHEHNDRMIKDYEDYKQLRHSYYLTEMRWPSATFWYRRH